jgi:hypothetical protein
MCLEGLGLKKPNFYLVIIFKIYNGILPKSGLKAFGQTIPKDLTQNDPEPFGLKRPEGLGLKPPVGLG